VTPDALPAPSSAAPVATRRDLQLGRRLFHVANGTTVATAYALFFTHEQVIHVFGTIACVVYVLDRVRIAYPDTVERHVPWVNRLLVRAEERVREAAMTPYAIAVLLTILTVPKPAALIAIYTLAMADPAAAFVGIRLGRRRIAEHRTLEGSAAFCATTLVVAAVVLSRGTSGSGPAVAGAAVVIALVAALGEMVPLRIDDNLTIPLFVGFVAWIVAELFGVPLS
jgi:dolichol kinase